MLLFLQAENHKRPLDRAGEFISGIAVEPNAKTVEFCDRLELWDAELVVRLGKDEEIVGHRNVPARGRGAHPGSRRAIRDQLHR